jgi:CBS domain-containing protein
MSEQTAADIMTRNVVAVRPETTLREIAELLVEREVSGAPVVDAAGQLVGVVSEADLIDATKRRAAIPRAALFGVIPVPDEVWLAAYEEGDRLAAADVMTRSVIALPETTPTRELADRMLRHRVNRIPIVQDGRLVGIVTRGDLLRAHVQEEAHHGDTKGDE